ncbi:MAG: hypothetical protein KDA80_02950 [Planctomycetaceae bacterium]|nr:hypothetical protein [Planctomycetaceae bacterium]
MPRSKQALVDGRGRQQLLAWSLLIVIVWGGFLPWLAAQPQMEARLIWLDEQKIDPSAMFYTELEAMEPILDKLRKKERQTRK